MERILLPYDGSPTAAAIVPRISGWLLRCKLEVVVLRVVDLQSAGAAAYPIEGVAAASLLAEMEKEAHRSAASMVAELTAAGLTARAEVSVGRPVSEILDAAEQHDPAFIALTTHGRTGVARWAFGSVTEKVLRRSRHPLLVLPSFTRKDGARIANEAPLDPKHILVPIDGSALARDVAPHASAFARQFDADIIVVHVVPPGLGDLPRPLATLQVETARDEYRGAGVRADSLLCDGDAAAEIVDAAALRDVGLIVMSTHGRTGWDRWTIGSVAERVLRTAPCPVLVVRSHAPATPTE